MSNDLKRIQIETAIDRARRTLALLIDATGILHNEREDYRHINDRLVDEADTAFERIRYLEECVRVRDEAATAGLCTMDYCGYCGQEGPSRPNILRTDRIHRIPCPIKTHPLKPADPKATEAEETEETLRRR